MPAARLMPCITCSSVRHPDTSFVQPLRSCYKYQGRARSLSLASSQAAHSGNGQRRHMSAEEAQKGLQYQLDRSPQLLSAPAPAQHTQPQEAYETELKRRQISAREWIAPWLVRYCSVCPAKAAKQQPQYCETLLQTGQARSNSLDTMAALRKSRTADLSPQQQDTALKRLLGKSWQVSMALIDGGQ